MGRVMAAKRKASGAVPQGRGRAEHDSDRAVGRGRVTARPDVVGREAAVSTGHPLATLAAMRILDAGGNATDAGVAAGLALGVLQPDIVGLTGVAPIIHYDAATEAVTTISGLGRWPRAASLGYFQERHGGELPLGVERSVVPASIDAWVTALELHGTKSFEEVATDAQTLAAHGFAAHELLCETIAEDIALYRTWRSSAAVFLPKGRAPRVGEPFVQADLGRTIGRLIQAERRAGGGRKRGLAAVREAFYDGPVARDIARFYKDEGGLLTARDLRDFRVHVEPPVHIRIFGYDVYACGPWCQGPVLLAFLRLLENDDLRGMGHNSTAYVHLLTEAMKLGFADREAYFGDPEFVDVPLAKLLSRDYARTRRALVRPDRAFPDMPAAGDVGRGRPAAPGGRNPRARREARDTTYLCVVDRDGNGFSATPSDGYSTCPIIPGLGFAASTRGDQSWLVEGHASVIAPWKRPRLTPNPALVLKNGKLHMTLGTPGGDVQCQAMLQVLLNALVFDMAPQAAIEAPRFASYSFPNSFYPHESQPGLLRIERDLVSSQAKLERRGHRIQVWPPRNWRAGGVCAIVRDPATGFRVAGADPRRECYALAW